MVFTERFEERGHRPALIFPNRALITYAELARRVTALAQEFGAEKRLVAIVAEPTEHSIIPYLAALHGNHAVALLPPCKAAALDDFIADFDPDIVFRRFDGRWRCQVRAGVPKGGLHGDLALMLGTSGSTGKSQYVRLSASAVEANAKSIRNYLDLTHADRAALILPFHYSYGLSILNSHLIAGASIYFPQYGASDAGFVEELCAAACTNIGGVPYSYEQMEQAGFRERELPELRFMTVAGGRLSDGLAETFRAHLAQRNMHFFMMYGQTEATARIAYVPPAQLAGNIGSIGIAIPGGSLWLADEDGHPIHRDGEVGELIYSGPNVMMGYASSRDDLSKGSEIVDLRTGDMARRDSQGFYSVVGRRKRMSKIAGLRVSHEAIEAAFDQAGITAAVMGDDERLLALVISTQKDDEVFKVMMAASGLPRLYLEISRGTSLPRLASGKVDYSALQLRLREGQLQENAGVLAAFRHAFYPRHVAPEDTFEGLGGDSLLYVQLGLTLERKLGYVPQGWETMPVARLCRTVRVPSSSQSVESQLVLRALAILMIVIHHATLWPIPGGAAVLVLLVGYSLARFQRQRLFAGDTGGVLRPLGACLAAYAPLVAIYSLVRGEVLWPSIFLVGNLGFAQPPHMMPYMYWFVEAYVQCVILWAALFCVAPLRRYAQARPFAFGALLLAVGVAGKFLVPLVWNRGGAQILTMPDVFYLTALGWCLHFAGSRAKRWVIALTVAPLCVALAWYGGNWTGSWVKYAQVLSAALVLLFIPRMALPKHLAQLILPIAAASYHIYLYHRIIPEWLLQQSDLAIYQPAMNLLSIVTGLLSGLAAFLAQKQLKGWIVERQQYKAAPLLKGHV